MKINQKELLEKWNTKWDYFKEIIALEMPNNVYIFFKNTKIIKAEHCIPLLAIKTDFYTLFFDREGVEYQLTQNSAKPSDIVIKEPTGLFDNTMFKTKFSIDEKRVIEFGKMLVEFGIVELCNDIGEFVDYYTPAMEKRTPEQKEEVENWSKILTTKNIKSIVNELVEN